jgi:hypothetical protein
MALFNRTNVLSRATTILREDFNASASTEALAIESAFKQFSRPVGIAKTYDIFLSHSYSDRKGALGIKNIIEKDFGYSVYIDWIADNYLNRNTVSAATATQIKNRMTQCKCLLYVTSTSASSSKWMPWETGLMDGLKNRVAICPFNDSSETDTFSGQEYLGVYPYITINQKAGTSTNYLWIRKDINTYVIFEEWLDGREPTRH